MHFGLIDWVFFLSDNGGSTSQNGSRNDPSSGLKGKADRPNA